MLSRREIVGSVFAASALAARAEAADAPAQMNSQFAFEAAVSVATPLVLGPGSHGLRRVVPITGGTVKGPRLTGRVVPGGADWQSEYYFRTIAEFEAPTERAYAWLNRSVFVGVAERTASAAIIRFYEVL